MMHDEWLAAPIGIDSAQWVSRPIRRSVLFVAHTMVSCQRLLDVLDYVESDPRIQVVFTVAPDVFNHEVGRYLRQLGALVVPWSQAVRQRFDLALASAHGGLNALHAPLMVMAHGAGHGKLARTADRGGPALRRPVVYGLDAQRLTRDGRVLASVLLLCHDNEREVLRRQCPEALPVAVVAGDPCFDRLVASVPWRGRYRRALRIRDDQELVVVSSTWGRDGLFGGEPDLLPRLMDQLPAARFRVAALLHPAVWSAHGTRQVGAWLRDCRDAGLILLDPAQDWRVPLVAADHVIGDHGSVTVYAAAIGRPVLRLRTPGAALAPGSAAHVVATRAGCFDPRRPVIPQLRAAPRIDPCAVVAAVTARPGQAAPLIRRAMYRLLRLNEPGRHRRAAPVPVPPALPVPEPLP